MTDDMILDLFFERSEQALEAVSSKYGYLAKHIAGNILRSEEDSEECLNDTWLALWNAIPPERPQKLQNYVSRVARNQALCRLRNITTQKRSAFYAETLDELAEIIPGIDTAESETEGRLLGEAINAFLSALPQTERQIFVRRYWFADSVQEIADAYRIRPGHVSVMLHRTRGKLKNSLLKEGFFL